MLLLQYLVNVHYKYKELRDMAGTLAVVCLIALPLVSGVPLVNKLQHSIEEEDVKVDISISIPRQCCCTHTPASCYEIMKTMAVPPSGYYMIRSSNGSEVRVYCDMTKKRCNSTPGWARVAVGGHHT